MPEAALSGTIPYRPPNATATVEMPVQQDIQCEVIQRELSLKKKKKRKSSAALSQGCEAKHCNAFKYI